MNLGKDRLVKGTWTIRLYMIGMKWQHRWLFRKVPSLFLSLFERWKDSKKKKIQLNQDRLQSVVCVCRVLCGYYDFTSHKTRLSFLIFHPDFHKNFFLSFHFICCMFVQVHPKSVKRLVSQKIVVAVASSLSLRPFYYFTRPMYNK